MTNVEIIKTIKEEVISLKQEREKLFTDLKFIEDVFLCVQDRRLLELEKLNILSFLMVFYKVENDELSLAEIKAEIEPFCKLLSQISIHGSMDFIEALDYIVNFSGEDIFKEFLKEKNNLKIYLDEFKLIRNHNVDDDTKDAILKVLSVKKNCTLDNNLILKTYNFLKENEDMAVALYKNIQIIKICNRLSKIFERKTKTENFETIQKKEKKYKEFLYEICDVSYLIETIRKIENYYFDISKKVKSKTRKIDKQVRDYEAFLKKYLEAFKEKEILQYRDLIDKLAREDLKLEVLKQIYQHNQKSYENLTKNYEIIVNDDKLIIQNLLSNYNLQPGEYILEKILCHSYDEIKQMLELMTSMQFDKNLIIYSLEKTNLERLNQVFNYIKRGICSKEFIQMYPQLLVNSELQKNFQSNINLMDELEINPNIFEESLDTLLIAEGVFKKNIQILEQYNLLDSIKTTNNYQFLKDENLVEKIDKYLELGLEEFIVKNLDLLNRKNIERLYLLKILNIPIDTEEELEEYLKEHNYFVKDEEIEEYLPDTVKYKIDEEDFEGINLDLESFAFTERTYNINGVIISRNKVQRNLDDCKNDWPEEKKVKWAVLKNSILKDTEYQLLMRGLKGQTDDVSKKKSFY